MHGIYHTRTCVLCGQRRPLVHVRVHISTQALRMYVCVSHPSSQVRLSACLSVCVKAHCVCRFNMGVCLSS